MVDAVGTRQNLERSGVMPYVPCDPADIHKSEPTYPAFTDDAIVVFTKILFSRICVVICVQKIADPATNAEYVAESVRLNKIVSKFVDIYELGDANGLPALYAMLALRNVKKIKDRMDLADQRARVVPIRSNLRLYQMALIAYNVALLCQVHSIVVPE